MAVTELATPLKSPSYNPAWKKVVTQPCHLQMDMPT